MFVVASGSPGPPEDVKGARCTGDGPYGLGEPGNSDGARERELSDAGRFWQHDRPGKGVTATHHHRTGPSHGAHRCDVHNRGECRMATALRKRPEHTADLATRQQGGAA